MDKKFITKRNYIRSLTCQPFFVWNSLAQKEDDELEDQDFLDLLWDEDEDQEENENFGQRMAKTFRLVDDHLVEKLAKKGDIEIIKGTTEEAIAKTKSLLNSQKILIAPVFEFQGAIAKPFAFDTVSKTIITIKYSLKTKRIDFAKGYYDYAIVAKQTPVSGFELYLPVNVPMKKGQIELIAVRDGWASMTAHLPEESTSEEGKAMQAQNFLLAFKLGYIQTAKLKNGEYNIDLAIHLQPIEKIIEQINGYKNENKISANIKDDVTVWGSNPEWNELLEKIDCPFAGFSGKVIPKAKVVESMMTSGENVSFDIEALNSVVGSRLSEFNYSGSTEPIIDKNNLDEVEIIQKAKKVVWYDFEGFSLPIAPLDYVLPYRQVVFQVSVIETENDKETRVDNLVVDPQTLSLDDFIKIIKVIYRENTDAYVVYNKSYEISRMNEMLLLLQNANHPEARIFETMLQEITDKTVDLYKLFAINSARKIPAILLPDQKGRASIKNVEKYITKHQVKLPRLITPYKELEVSNGGMAMSLAIDRALDIIGDKEWAEKVVSLKKYCENDVRAMIMVYDFVLKLAGENAK